MWAVDNWGRSRNWLYLCGVQFSGYQVLSFMISYARFWFFYNNCQNLFCDLYTCDLQTHIKTHIWETSCLFLRWNAGTNWEIRHFFHWNVINARCILSVYNGIFNTQVRDRMTHIAVVLIIEYNHFLNFTVKCNFSTTDFMMKRHIHSFSIWLMPRYEMVD